MMQSIFSQFDKSEVAARNREFTKCWTSGLTQVTCRYVASMGRKRRFAYPCIRPGTESLIDGRVINRLDTKQKSKQYVDRVRCQSLSPCKILTDWLVPTYLDSVRRRHGRPQADHGQVCQSQKVGSGNASAVR